MTERPDVLVVGGGPAGLAAAARAAETGARTLVLERDPTLGGILPQCIHDGFGVELWGESLTGPEFATHIEAEARERGVETHTDATVVRIDPDLTTRVLGPFGYEELRPAAAVLAMGCRERAFGALRIPSSRPAGIMTAGTAQRLVNLDGLMVGSRVVVLGSGDVGLIMARRMTLEGAEVAGVVEQMDFAGGLARNVVQCLNDFEIPLMLRHTVVEVLGRDRVTGVVVAPVDEHGIPSEADRTVIECDTLLVSTGLIPENELTTASGGELDDGSGGPVVDQRMMTSVPGLFACGNVVHVHDLVDWACLEGQAAGEAAARYAGGAVGGGAAIPVTHADDLRYAVPQRLLPGEPATISVRVREPARKRKLVVAADGEEIAASSYPQVSPSEIAVVDVPALPETLASVEVRLERG
jgi:NADPH-dependent 2,4-dienoyl-CoA reductase/sulfur reductase-like enzyme